jgi:hypothetical protein
MIEEVYKDIKIIAVPVTKGFCWMFKFNDTYYTDGRTIDGSQLQSEKHAINDAKKNIDSFLRLT